MHQLVAAAATDASPRHGPGRQPSATNEIAAGAASSAAGITAAVEEMEDDAC